MGPDPVTIVIALIVIAVVAYYFTGGELAKRRTFAPIGDSFETLEELQAALRKAGLESSQLILAIDCTKSNTWTGTRSFGGRCLHEIAPTAAVATAAAGGAGGAGAGAAEGGADANANANANAKPQAPQQLNPYQQVMSVIARTLATFDDDGLIPLYGFGDARTTDKSVFTFHPPGAPCQGLDAVLACYNTVMPGLQLAGPTSFAPIIREAITQVRASKQYTILVIIADGQIDRPDDTAAAIVEASNYPLSIVTVGVGDGPWDTMHEFDDGLPKRLFDNFQFVDATTLLSRTATQGREPAVVDAQFALAALQEIPEQYKAIKALKLLDVA